MAAPFGPIVVVGFCPVPVAATFYGGDMGTHHHAEHPWQVRVSGDTRGAGVLLDERHVLTCAHVVGGEDERVSVASSFCRPEWSTGARVVPGSWATSDTLHVAAAVLGSRILGQAADAYDRAARAPYGRIPPPTPTGNQLRQAARLLSAFAYLTGDQSLSPIVFITRLAALAEAVAELRESQQHAAQAAAARVAAERLYTATRPGPAAPPGSAARASTAAQLAALSFPPATSVRQPPVPGQRRTDQGGPQPLRRASPPRPRGPSR